MGRKSRLCPHRESRTLKRGPSVFPPNPSDIASCNTGRQQQEVLSQMPNAKQAVAAPPPLPAVEVLLNESGEKPPSDLFDLPDFDEEQIEMEDSPQVAILRKLKPLPNKRAPGVKDVLKLAWSTGFYKSKDQVVPLLVPVTTGKRKKRLGMGSLPQRSSNKSYLGSQSGTPREVGQQLAMFQSPR